MMQKIFIKNNINIFSGHDISFFFIDPFDYSFLKEDIDFIFEQCKKCEILLFIPISHIWRFKNQKAVQKITDFLKSYGIDVPENENPADFIENIRKTLSETAICASAELKDKQNTYALFFMSKNLKGVDVFLQARDKVFPCKQDALFDFEGSPTYKIKSKIVENPINNIDLYQWGLSHNLSTKQIIDALKKLLKSDEIQKNPKTKTGLYISYKEWKVKTPQVTYSFNGEKHGK